MKKFIIILTLIAMALIIWFNLGRQRIRNNLPPVQNLLTNLGAAQSSAVLADTNIGAIQPVISSDTSQVEMMNALTTTNLAQWKVMIRGLHYSDKFVDKKNHGWESWVMAEKDLNTSVPVRLEGNGQVVIYKANFVDVDALIDSGEVQSVKMHSRMMNIEETQALGLELCKILQIDPKDFLAWSVKVGDHWLDAPLFSTGADAFGFGIHKTYNDEKPWYVRVVVQRHP